MKNRHDKQSFIVHYILLYILRYILNRGIHLIRYYIHIQNFLISNF